jgi:hypothetical protein
MIMTPLAGLVGSGVPSLTIGSGAVAAILGGFCLGLVALGVLVMLAARRMGRP